MIIGWPKVGCFRDIWRENKCIILLISGYLLVLIDLLFNFSPVIGAIIPATSIITNNEQEKSSCLSFLRDLPLKYNKSKIDSICSDVSKLAICNSIKNQPIFHYEKVGQNKKALKILAFALIHGDEPLSASAARAWMERLVSITPRNSWRIIPITNPDGWKSGIRGNANGVDLNRNFPTKNWEKESDVHWKRHKHKDPRRYPGKSAGSELETRCLIEHINNYQPDFVVAIHTPLGLLDFDGPDIKYPKKTYLPWIKLGTYPGSLGRYLWRERKTPVLTIELKEANYIQHIKELDELQDISGLMAIMANSKYQNRRAIDD
ncbi:MAG: succinylglutamate desuccinylase/aspartoacylase family protein [Oligoflexia bacterium]|nr:succinylglutamate desuccinylase/aspartoacylase family protein [Oligoflexia bacterium]